MNDNLYVHEYIDIIGHQREKYMYHMAANWSPGSQRDRGEQCFGVWAVVGTTYRFPMTLNLWERPGGWEGMARTLEYETTGRGEQDPQLQKWWSGAAALRSGGSDRIMVPASWMPTIQELCDGGVRGVVYAHEMVSVRPGTAREFLERAREGAAPALGRYNWRLVGALTTAMRNDDEAVLLWAIPTWNDWSAGEAAYRTDDDVRAWRTSSRDVVTGWHRMLVTDSALSPMKLGRQPNFDDRVEDGQD